MFTISRRDFFAHLSRYVMSLVAIALGVSFVVASFCLRELMQTQVNSMLSTDAAGDVYVVGATVSAASAATLLASGGGTGSGAPAGSSTGSAGLSSGQDSGSQGGGAFSALLDSSSTVQLPVSLDLAKTIGQMPQVSFSYPSIIGMVALVGKDGTAVGGSGQMTIGTTANGANPNYALAQGAWPKGYDQIALTDDTMAAGQLRIGDTTKIVTQSGGIQSVTVVGRVTAKSAQAGVLLVGVSEQAAEKFFAPTGQVQQIQIYGKNPDGSPSSGLNVEQQKVLAKQIQSKLYADGQKGLVTVETGDQMRSKLQDTASTLVGFVQTFILVFALLALVTGAFIIMNTFSMIVRDRMREFAVLRSIGAAPGQVFGTVITEALGLGVLGSAIGVGFGAVWMQILIAAFNAMGKPMSGYAGLNVQSVVIGVLTGVVVSFVSAVLPSRMAALTPPIEAMNEAVRPERPLRTRSIVGFVMLAIGVASLVLATRYGTDPDSVPSAFQGLDTQWAFGIGAGFTLIGAIVFAPTILPLIVSIIGWPVNYFVQPVGQLASQNVTRNRRRSASTAGALVIGMAIVALFSTAAASLKTSTAYIVESHVAADFSVQSALFTVPNDVVEKLTKVDGVSSVVALQQHSAVVDKSRGTAVRAAGDLFGAALSVKEYDGVDPHQAIAGGEAVLGRDFATNNNLEVGDDVEVSAVQAVGSGKSAQPVTVRVGTVVQDTLSGLDSDILLPAKVYDSQFDATSSTILNCYIVAGEGANLVTLHKQLNEAVKPYYVLSVLTKQELISYQGSMIDQVTTMLYALLALSVFIALLGIANTLALSVSERTREIGLLRAVGFGRAQLRVMFMIESVLISLIGTLIGMAVGVGIGSTLPGIFSSQGLTHLSIPWSQIVLFLVVSVVIGIMASVGPSRKALKIPVLAAIVTE